METTPQRVRETLRINPDPISLETPVGDEGTTQLGDCVEDDQAQQPFEVVDEVMQRQELELILSVLRHHEREVIELRFGLGSARPHTLEEVGRTFGVSRERIRQIESRALLRLKQQRRLAAEGVSRVAGSARRFDRRSWRRVAPRLPRLTHALVHGCRHLADFVLHSPDSSKSRWASSTTVPRGHCRNDVPELVASPRATRARAGWPREPPRPGANARRRPIALHRTFAPQGCRPQR